jgi:hypothetical protein
MLGSSRVAAQLAASREGLSSMSEGMVAPQQNLLSLPPAYVHTSHCAHLENHVRTATCADDLCCHPESFHIKVF